MTVLHQVAAAVQAEKERVTKRVTALLRSVQAADLFGGLRRTFHPVRDGDQVQPPQSKRVQLRANDVLAELRNIYAPLFDMLYRMEATNCLARADVILSGEVLLPSVPVTVLMGLEKRMTDIRTLISAIPVLSSDEEWTFDASSGEYNTDVVQTAAMRREKTIVQKAAATDKFPAQVELVDSEVMWGVWATQKLSAALTPERRRQLVDRCDALIAAIRDARIRANMISVDPSLEISSPVADKIFAQLLQ